MTGPLRLAGAVCAALAVATAVPQNAQLEDWSGVWHSRAGTARVLRNVHSTAQGWDGFAQALVRTEYDMVVRRQADDISVAFPQSRQNILTLPAAAIGAGPRTTVDSRGDYWVKRVTTARAIEKGIELTSTSTSGWWRNGGPDQASPAETDLSVELQLERSAEPQQLTLRVRLEDEKGRLEYVQPFVLVGPGR